MAKTFAHTRIRFHGIATYEILANDGRRVLCDPYFEENPAAVVNWDSFDRIDLLVISHAAVDHLGDADKLALKYGCPVVCGGEVKRWLVDRGVKPETIQATTWGIRVRVAGFEVQPLECRHWSQITLKDGSFISGTPMAYIVYVDGVRFYHYGDTAIFSDLKLHGELYRPNVGCVGIAIPREMLHRFPMPGEMLTCEMSPYEGFLAAGWLGLDTVFPCHYCVADGDPDVAAYMQLHNDALAAGRNPPHAMILNGGDWVDFDAAGNRIDA